MGHATKIGAWLALVALTGCQYASSEPPAALVYERAPDDAPHPLHWPAKAFPLRVHAVDCAEQMPDAFAYWEQVPGELFALASGASDVELDADASKVDHGLLGETWVDGETVPVIGHAQTSVTSCDPYVIAHELGHVLGFEHTDRAGALMNTYSGPANVEVSEGEDGAVTAMLWGAGE